MRRLGIALGVIGGIFGTLTGYPVARELWSEGSTGKRFASLVRTEAIRQVSKTAVNCAEVNWSNCFEPRQTDGLHYPPNDSIFVRLKPQYTFDLRNPPPQASSVRDARVTEVRVDRSGEVSWVKLSTGESIEKPEVTSAMSYFKLFLPLIGFLLGWGIVRATAWIWAGFLSQ
jgi:hypothetical protein